MVVYSLREVVSTLREVVLTLREVVLTLREVVPTLREVVPTLREVVLTLREVVPTLREVVLTLREVVPTLKEMVPTLREVVLTLREVVLTLREVVLMIKAIILNLKTTTYYLYFTTFALNHPTMRYLYITLISCFLALNLPLANAQIITTIAGGGNCGSSYCGDGGQATSATLFGPAGMALDVNGNIYVADNLNSAIRKIDTNGIITTIAGTGNGARGYSGDGGSATNALLYYPGDIKLDNSGNLYISDFENYRIRKINTAGIINTIAGNGTLGSSGDGGSASNAQLNYPEGIFIDGTGNLYINERYRVRMVGTNGIITTIIGNGTAGYSGDGGNATNAEINIPAGITMDASGNIYFADQINNRIRVVNTNGIISTFAGNGIEGFSGDGSFATSAEINSPGWVLLDAYGNLYFTDEGNNRVRKVNASGMINTIVGNGTGAYAGDGGLATNAELWGPNGIILDNLGNLFCSEGYNNRIRKVTNVAAAGIEQFTYNNEQVMVYPNPTTGMLHVEGILLNEPTEVTIIDMLGNSVYHSTFTTQHNSINIAELNSGVYVIELSNSKGKFVKRLIKE